MDYKKYESLTFADDFMFGTVTLDKSISRELLACLLQREVGELEDIQDQKEYKYAYEGKKIRMDLYTKENDNIYDAEMQRLDNRRLENLELSKRSHYYHSMIAVDQLNKGDNYRLLENSNVIFICTFDPFGMDYPWYHFSMRDERNKELELEYGVHSYFFNAMYSGDDAPEGIKNLYRYIQTQEVSDELTNKIHEAVKKARMNSKWRSIYMKERIILMEQRLEGREEGREEGIVEGRINMLLDIVKDGLISVVDAAQKAGMSVDEFESIMKKQK